MEEKSIRHQYLRSYTDEQLTGMVTFQRDEFDDDILKAAEEILIERGYDVEYEDFKAEPTDPVSLELSNGQVLFDPPEIKSDDGILDRINTLVDSIEEEEHAAEEHFSQKYKTQNDQGLLQEYIEVCQKVEERSGFGARTHADSLKNYQRLLTEVQARVLEIPEEFQTLHLSVSNRMRSERSRRYRRDGNIKLLIGIFLVLLVLFSLLAGLIRFSILFLGLIGFTNIGAAISDFGNAKRLKREIAASRLYNS